MPSIIKTAYAFALAAILLTALYMRTAGLNEVQDFNGDQGRDYLVVMRWFQDGHWPLLGPERAIGDSALGPGWFYTIAPALALSRWHPVAGAATIAVLSVLAIWLAADWLRRTTGSRITALVIAAVWTFSTPWTDQARTLWNPNVLPLGVAALAWLLAVLPRRPLPCLTAALGLLAILPQWHTTGLLVDAAALPCMGLALAGAWPVLRRARRRGALLWTAALGLWIVLLYLPPLIYELRPGAGNLVSFFSKSLLPPQPYSKNILFCVPWAFDKLICLQSYLTFLADNTNVSSSAVALRLALGGLIAVTCLGIMWRDLRKRKDQPDPPASVPSSGTLSAAFLVLLVAGFWLVLALKGSAVQDYYLFAPETAILLLFGWTAGRLIAGPSPRRLNLRKLAGTGLLLLAGALCLAQAPYAWAIHQGRTRYGFSFKVAREIAQAVARDANGIPYSLELAEANNFPAHYFYLLRRLGRPPLNSDYYAHAIARPQFGARIYLIVAPGMDSIPVLDGVRGPLPLPLHVGNVLIYPLDPAAIAPGARQLKLVINGSAWELEAKQ